eukprot:scaffold368604_cov28-Prasinocladus_malaysianus.AAC.1
MALLAHAGDERAGGRAACAGPHPGDPGVPRARGDAGGQRHRAREGRPGLHGDSGEPGEDLGGQERHRRGEGQHARGDQQDCHRDQPGHKGPQEQPRPSDKGAADNAPAVSGARGGADHELVQEISFY